MDPPHTVLIRYQHGLGVARDIETAGFYSTVAAEASNTAFHALGGMPVAETDRIDENTEKSVEIGNMVRYCHVAADVVGII